MENKKDLRKRNRMDMKETRTLPSPSCWIITNLFLLCEPNSFLLCEPATIPALASMVHSDHETLLFLGFFYSIFRKAPQSREIENEKKIKKERAIFSPQQQQSLRIIQAIATIGGDSLVLPSNPLVPLCGLSDSLDPAHQDAVAAHLRREFYCVPILERFILHEKVPYLVYGLRKSIRSCVWLTLIGLENWTAT